MDAIVFSERRPVPINPDFTRELAFNTTVTDIIAPELMDVPSVRSYTFPLYRVPRINVNKSEPGYSAYTASREDNDKFST